MQKKTKFGFISLHNLDSTYDNNIFSSAKKVCEDMNVECLFKVNVKESKDCYYAAEDLVKDGCKGIFANSFGHEAYLIDAAVDYKDVQFAHATGTKAHTEKLHNFHNAFAHIYEGRYLTGIAAGMKLKEMIEKGQISKEEARVGYVGAYPKAEVISGYTAFFLGVRSVCDFAKMTVRYTQSWNDEEKEAEIAKQLIEEDKCKIISQHTDSQGAPRVCEEKKIPNVCYNIENTNYNNSYLISSKINWDNYFRYFINNTIHNKSMDYDWKGTLADGSVHVFPPSSLAAPNTKEAINKATDDLKKGNIRVFDIDKFTVNGKKLESYLANVDDDEYEKGDTEVVYDNYFHESEKRSAPYFDVRIDGIDVYKNNDDPKPLPAYGTNINCLNFYYFFLLIIFLF